MAGRIESPFHEQDDKIASSSAIQVWGSGRTTFVAGKHPRQGIPTNPSWYKTSKTCRNRSEIHLHVLHILMWTYSVWIPPHLPPSCPPFFLPLPGVQSGPCRSDVDPFITILPSWRFNERGEEKMSLRWYHWVSRWVAVSVRFNGGLQRFRSLTPPDSSTLTEGNKPAQVSSLEVPWMSSEQQEMRLDPGGVWAEMR